MAVNGVRKPGGGGGGGESGIFVRGRGEYPLPPSPLNAALQAAHRLNTIQVVTMLLLLFYT